MRVEVWCRSMAVPVGSPSLHRMVMAWDDPDSRNQQAAAQRAVELTNAFPGNLEGWMAEVRKAWDSVAGGLSFGVGDYVLVDGKKVERVPGGLR